MAAKKKATKRKVAKKTTAKPKVAKKTTAKRKVAKKTTAKRKVVKKTTAKRKVAKKATAKRSVVKKSPAKTAAKAPAKTVKSVSKAYTKSEIMTYLAEHAGITKKEASAAYDALNGLIAAHLKSKKVASFTFPGLAKCVVNRKAATKARKGINPFTGEPTVFKAKPARNIVKVRALKALKDMV
jgi:nucleoid DNA-binding protein